MRPSRRKLTLQLTPLLDLLLIVIFAQYMAMQQETVKAETLIARRIGTAQQELEQARRRAADAMSRAAQQEEWLTQRARRAEEQRETVGELAAELFHVPLASAEQSLLRALRTEEIAGQVRSPEEVTQLRQQLRRLSELGAGELVEHLLTYHELRKRADVWSVYVRENGVIAFEAGERSFEFRARSADEFAQELYQRYRTLPQPKGLVIVLLSYADITEGQARDAILGLQRATERMNDDAGRRSRFEFALVGLRPQEPAATP